MNSKDKMREWRKNNQARAREIDRKSYLKTKYGLTEDQFDKMVKEQNGECAICNTQFASRPQVDHCHDTGVIRGLLCGTCNKLLGFFEKGKMPDKSIFVRYLLENG